MKVEIPSLQYISLRGLSTSINDLYRQISSKQVSLGQTVTLSGWVKYFRKFNTHTFLHLNDGLSPQNLQVVLNHRSPEHNLLGSAVQITGQLHSSPGRKQTFELRASSLLLVAPNHPRDFPLSDLHPLESSRHLPHLRPKISAFASLLRCRHHCASEIHDFFKSLSFVHIHPPVLTTNDCEGGSNVFRVSADSVPQNFSSRHFFPHPVYLTVSSQFHLEAMMTSLARVYSFGPVFRADYSDSSRHHLAEFYMLEAELAFVDGLEDMVLFVEEMLFSLVERLRNRMGDDLETILSHPDSNESQLESFTRRPYPRVTHRKAVEILLACPREFKKRPNFGEDLSKEHELYLCEHFGGVPVFLVEFPPELKPFYVKRSADGKAMAFDLLGPSVGEVVGGSLREDDCEELVRKMGSLDEEARRSLEWYVELRKFGCPPHGGFGLGFERLLQAFLGVPNIRDTIPFPRYSDSCSL